MSGVDVRGGPMAVAAWLGAAVVAGSVVWGAVSVLGVGGGRNVLSAAEVSGAAARASSVASVAPASASSGTSAPTHPPAAPTATAAPVTTVPTATTPATTAPTGAGGGVTTTAAAPGPPAVTPVARTWNVPGGTVSAACTGSAISLVFATPADGWRLRVSSPGPEHVELKLTSGEKQTEVEATCVAGVPTAKVEQKSGSD